MRTPSLWGQWARSEPRDSCSSEASRRRGHTTSALLGERKPLVEQRLSVGQPLIKSLLFASLCPDGLVKCNGSPLCKTRTHLKIHPALFIPNPHIRSTDAGQGKLTGVHDTSGLEQNGLRGFYGDGIFGFRLKSADLTLTEVKSV